MRPSDRRERLVERLRRQDRVTDDSVLDALRSVPRHEFVTDSKQHLAYRDTPLPIGNGQTISAPHMVGIMTALLDVGRGDRVLEIGTGCGYHAAVTAEVVGAANVYSVEYHDSLATQARKRLDRVGYGDVSVRVGDGHDGWPDHAPYDAAYLTCAADSIPDAIVEQLTQGGYLVAPIGEESQRLVRARETSDGALEREDHGGVRFVRMQG
jgi:protein-L-isoaspartate(D-aspartate) O-methyltransferase